MIRFLKYLLLDIYHSEILPLFYLIIFIAWSCFLSILLADYDSGLVFLGSIIIAGILSFISGRILIKALRWILVKSRKILGEFF